MASEVDLYSPVLLDSVFSEAVFYMEKLSLTLI